MNDRELFELAKPEHPDLRKAAEMALDALEKGTTGLFIRAIPALRQALAQPEHPLDKKADSARELGLDYEPEQEPFNRLIRIMGTFDLATGHADNWDDLLDSLESELRDVLGHYREALKQDYGFDRTASHMAGEYVNTAQSKAMHEACIEASMRNKQPDQDQLAHDQITHGMSVTLDGKRVDPASIYKEPDQEPVAWRWLHNGKPDSNKCFDGIGPKREWVSLTDEEMPTLTYGLERITLIPLHQAKLFIRKIEAACREKNGDDGEEYLKEDNA